MISNANNDYYDYFETQDVNTGIKVATSGPTYRNPLALSDSAAAECVVKTHSTTPSNTGKVYFSGCKVSTDNSNGSQSRMPSGDTQADSKDQQKFYTEHLTLGNQSTTYATTSNLSNGTDFVVTLL
jgi:hypothetical protein